MGEPVRVLLIAPPDWKDRAVLERELTAVADEYPGRQLVLVHAAEPGSTTPAAALAHRLGYRLEPRYALWTRPCDLSFCPPEHRRPNRGRPGTYCPSAGVRRDLAMIESGADLCLMLVSSDPAEEPPACLHAITRAEIPIRRIEPARSPR